jgi:hypothetical protein
MVDLGKITIEIRKNPFCSVSYVQVLMFQALHHCFIVATKCEDRAIKN